MADLSWTLNQRMTIRAGRSTLSFSVPDGEQNVRFAPYVVKSGVSMAANLREAFKSFEFLSQLPNKARLVVDSDVVLMPINLFDENEIESQYVYSFPSRKHDHVFYNVMSELNVVAVSSVNKDLKLVVEDHFRDVRLLVALWPVWRYMHQRSFTDNNQKLYGYVHEQRLDVFAFQQNRFKFSNSYDIKHVKDACYFLLYVWQLLQMDAQKDELHLMGDLFQRNSVSTVCDQDELLKQLKVFLKNVYVVNPSSDIGFSSVAELKGMPYDLMILFVKGR